jgi:hypothetical protein
MDSDNYPETCHAIYIVNGGIAFGAIWRIVSPFVDKGTRDKVHVVGSGKYMRVSLGHIRGARMRRGSAGSSACATAGTCCKQEKGMFFADWCISSSSRSGKCMKR